MVLASASFSVIPWRDFQKMSAIEKVATTNYIKELVENQGKTHKENSQLLKHNFQGVCGISERRVRRFCAEKGIQCHDSNVTSSDVDDVVSSAIARVCVHVLDFVI